MIIFFLFFRRHFCLLKGDPGLLLDFLIDLNSTVTRKTRAAKSSFVDFDLTYRSGESVRTSRDRGSPFGSLGGRGVAPIRESGDTMKKVLFSSVALIALGTGLASAADLPVKAPPAPVYAPPAFSWTGCYIGGNIGAAWAHSEWQDSLFGLSWG